ncbi:hypothetical protein U9M48_033280 [Paspalum notatum var. saurae]|uniref:Uncharacterized protein n=1 Tax=Paspalum notatum var. saurae TaxID=547442 RepID=A0AAQ3X5D7_PASNO
MDAAAVSNPSSKRIALVTGGNKGVGLETCRQLASKGIRVVLTARNEARGLEAVDGIRRAGGGAADVFFHQLDVTDPSSAARLAEFVRDQFGRLDILINNAGISGVDRDPVLVAAIKDQVDGMDVNQRVEWMRENSKETYDEAKQCMRTNYYGAKFVTEALLPLLQLSSSGRIVNVSSGFGLLRNFNSEELRKEFDDIENLTEKRLEELLDLFLEDFKANLVEAHGWPTGGSSAYKVAKAALNAYTRILAKKYPTLRINCLTPGYVKSDMSMHMGVLTLEEGARNPVKVALLPDDGPTGAYFDLNGQASFVTTPPIIPARIRSGARLMEDAISSPRHNTRIAVVTGGNRGIGLEVCRQLAGNGITVVLTALDEKTGLEAVEKLNKCLGLSDVISHQLDITDASSIARLADFLNTRFGKLDILVNNAAVAGIVYLQDPVDDPVTREENFNFMDRDQRLEWLWRNNRETYDAGEEGLMTNYYGTKHVIEALLPLLKASSDGRIVNVSSDFGLLRCFGGEDLKQELDDVGKLTEERLDELLDLFLKDFKAGNRMVEARGWPVAFSAYKVSKAAVNAYSRILAAKEPAVRVNCAHPGYVKTDITLHSGLLTPEEGARNVVKVALLPAGGVTGAFFEEGKELASFSRATAALSPSPSRPVPIFSLEPSSWFTPMEGAAAVSNSPATRRIAVVTGGNKGIGFEVCRQLAGSGATVVLTARDEVRGTAAVEKLGELGLSDVIFHQLEVTDASSIDRLAGFLKNRFGRLDILVNNAAIGGVELVDDPSFGPKPTVESFSGMDGHKMVAWMWKNCRQTYDSAKAGLQTNYYGTKHVTEALLPLLLSSSDARIVNVTSGFGLLRFFRSEELRQELSDVERLTEERLDVLLDTFLGDLEAGALEARGWPAEFPAYKVAKAAMNAYSRVTARRHPALRVNCVDPGYVRTDMTRNSGLLTPEEGGGRVAAVALLPQGGPTGAFFDDGKEASFM